MKAWGPMLLAALVAAAAAAKTRSASCPDASRRPVAAMGRDQKSPRTIASPEPAPLGEFTLSACGKDFEARLRSEPAFADRVFETFRSTGDPVRMSFLQNLLAEDPRRRNSTSWQLCFVRVAEADGRPERRKAALLFLQQAESIGGIREKLFALAAEGQDRKQALAALKGLPGRRLADSGLRDLASRLSETDSDPDIRHVALRILGGATLEGGRHSR